VRGLPVPAHECIRAGRNGASREGGASLRDADGAEHVGVAESERRLDALGPAIPIFKNDSLIPLCSYAFSSQRKASSLSPKSA
jgi:hypothetical protein